MSAASSIDASHTSQTDLTKTSNKPRSLTRTMSGDVDAADVVEAPIPLKELQGTSSSSSPVLAKQPPVKAPKPLRFWMIMLALSLCIIISVLELNSIPTALPTIVNELHGNDYIWVGSAYSIAGTAFIPVSGGLSQVFGRKPIMISCVLLFVIGSAICGAASNMNMLIAGRTVQGLGGGGMVGLPLVILSDLVPLRERGAFSGLLALAWCLGAGMGPVVGGALAENGQWRWLFYLNLPLCGVVIFLLMVFMSLKYPKGTLMEKLGNVDWIGNFLIVSSSCALAIALTWAGIQFAWSSVQVLVPLCLSIFGFAVFVFYEAKFATHPIVPWGILTNRTSLSGYVQAFTMTIVLYMFAYNLPIYFQAVLGATPIGAGVDMFTATFVVPTATLFTGVSVKITKKYRKQLYFGFIFMIAGFGALIALDAQRSRGFVIGIEVLFAIGSGVVYSASVFPVLAPLSVKEHPQANAFLVFVRSVGQVWGITISGTILQNRLSHTLPSAFFSQFPAGTSVAYSAIPVIKSLDPQTREAVRVAFASSLKTGWIVGTIIAGVGFIASWGMKGLVLHEETDEEWGLEGAEREKALV